MIVAVALVRMVQMTRHQVVEVLSVGNRLVAAFGSVRVPGLVPGALVPAGAAVGVLLVDRDHVVVDMIPMRVVQMAVVQEVKVRFVHDRGMPAAGSVDVLVAPLVGMLAACAHVVNGTQARGEVREAGATARLGGAP